MTMTPFTTVTGAATPLMRANVDTDVIVRIERLTAFQRDQLGPYAFEALRLRPDGSEDTLCVLNLPAFRRAPLLLAAENFGCGSSREGAVWALMGLGIRCVIAPSFGDIFFSNALKNGLLPVRLPEAVVQRMLDDLLAAPGTRMAVDLRTQTVTGPGGRVEPFHIDPFPRQCLLEGLDEIDYTLAQHAAIDAFEQGRARGAAPL